MNRIARLRFAAAIAAFAALAKTAQAQPMPSITIGKITTQKTCKVYQESAGRSATVATAYAYASVDSWRTWLVKDCTTNFASIRASLEAALAASGKFVVKPGGKYTLTGVISQIGGDPNAAPGDNVSGSSFSISNNSIFVSMEVTLRDSTGRAVYGGVLTKTIETASEIQTAGFSSASMKSGEGIYSVLQNQVALAVARLAAFHIVPLRVTGVEGNQIRLNYGAPLLTLGTAVEILPPSGFNAVRYAVTSSNPGGAVADQDNEANAAGVVPGTVATVIESDDPAVNARRTKRVDIP
jgi:hypothetical protein